jgi:hypothetical protein
LSILATDGPHIARFVQVRWVGEASLVSVESRHSIVNHIVSARGGENLSLREGTMRFGGKMHIKFGGKMHIRFGGKMH